MPTNAAAEPAATEVLTLVPSTKTIESSPTPSGPKDALRRCCTAWKRAYKAYIDEHKDTEHDRFYAAVSGNEAYCHALPLLAGYDGIRDFLACAAHGIVIGAIPREKSTQLLYAAQVAIAAIQHDRKQPKSPSA